MEEMYKLQNTPDPVATENTMPRVLAVSDGSPVAEGGSTAQVVRAHGGVEEHLEEVAIPKLPTRVTMLFNRKARRKLESDQRRTNRRAGVAWRRK